MNMKANISKRLVEKLQQGKRGGDCFRNKRSLMKETEQEIAGKLPYEGKLRGECRRKKLL